MTITAAIQSMLAGRKFEGGKQRASGKKLHTKSIKWRTVKKSLGRLKNKKIKT